MILHISRLRLIQFITIILLTIFLWLGIGHIVRQEVKGCPEGEVVLYFKFLAPMKPSSVNNLIIERLPDHRRVSFQHQWITASTLQITFPERDYPRGVQYKYYFKTAPTMIWPFYVWASGEFRSRVKVRFIGIENGSQVPSRGPVVLQFNTFIEPKEIHKYIITPEPGKLEPVIEDQSGQKDYSRWRYHPNKKLKNQHEYSLEIKRGLFSLSGQTLEQSYRIQFKTSPEFLIEQVTPRPDSTGVWLTRPISFSTNQPLKSASIAIAGLPGRCRVNGNQVYFTPDRVMLPGTTYNVKAALTSVSSEVITYQGRFHTTNLGKGRWLELKLGPSPRLWVMEGNQTKRTLEITVNSRHPIPAGTLYEESRGISPVKETQSKQWLRLNADILLHSLGGGLGDNHSLLGLPTSYSCVYLQKDDLDWLADYLPQGFMLISHE